MGMNAYLDHTPEDQRTLVDIENLFDGHCKCTTLTCVEHVHVIHMYVW